MSDADITLVVHAVGHKCTGVGSHPGEAKFFICPALVNLMRELVFHANKKPACLNLQWSQAIFFTCPALVNLMRQLVFHAQTKPA